jgi:hypothetical protein
VQRISANKKLYLGKLADGRKVYDRTDSHVKPVLIPLVRKSISTIDPKGEVFVEKEVIFPKAIGKCDIVETDSKDEVFFAKRENRLGLSRFVKNKIGEESNTLTIVLTKRPSENFFILVTAFIGKITPPEPYSPYATEESKKFWARHAFVWEENSVAKDRETSEKHFNTLD